MPSGELEDLLSSLWKKHKGQRVDGWYLQFAGAEDDLFIASGACDVLRERHGEDYVIRLADRRKPKTFGEKLRYWITGRMPEYKQ